MDLIKDLEKQIQELIKKFDSENPSEREKATNELIELGKLVNDTVKNAVEEHLKKAKNSKNTEVTYRCEHILNELSIYKNKSDHAKWVQILRKHLETCCYGKIHTSDLKPCPICTGPGGGGGHKCCADCAFKSKMCTHCGMPVR